MIDPRLVYEGAFFRREFMGAAVPQDIYIHVCGTDLIRDADGRYLVLEDNGRTPSGVSYMLQNRQVLKRVFPQLFERVRRPRASTTTRPPCSTCSSTSPRRRGPTRRSCCSARASTTRPTSSTASWPSGWASSWSRAATWSSTRTASSCGRRAGLERVDVIYRRIDDDFLDPLTFRPDSTLGVPGLVNAYRAGNVALANSIGTGIADDKGIYPFVPDMIRYYLKQDPILPNVETFRPLVPRHLQPRPGEPATSWWSRRSTSRAATAC